MQQNCCGSVCGFRAPHSAKSPSRHILTFLLLMVGQFSLFVTRANAAGLLIADGGLGGNLQIVQHEVNVVINNGVAVTTVTQVFQNDEDRQVEALYAFPVPRGASVSNFSMWINGKEMVGEVVEKQRARQIYESYKQRKRDPGLLEQVDYRTFEMRIFPIAPRAQQKVQVTYYQELNFDHDWATYVYPLATQTRPTINTRASGKFSIHADVKSEIPIVEMDSPSHAKDFAFVQRNENFREASLEATGGDLSRDVVLAFHCSRPRTGIDVVTSKASADEDGYLSLTLTAGEELPKQDMNMDYVFVLDVSGSMNDDGKLDLSRRAVQAFVNSLGNSDRFEVISFNIQPTPLFKSLRPADADAKKAAGDFLTGREARGGTVLNPAITSAYKYAAQDHPLNVIVLSDGLTEQTERMQLIELIRQRPQGTRVFCIGVGNDVNRALLEQLANESGGLAAFVSREDSFERQAGAFRRKLMHPIATKVGIAFEGAQVYGIEPQQLPNLYHGTPVRLYARYKGSGPVKINVTGDVQGKPLATSVSVNLPKQDTSSPEIERMWAWHKVDRLLKEADAGGTRSSTTLDQIIKLGEGYSIATEYTSFIVLENEAEYQRWSIERRNVLRIGRDRSSGQRLTAQLDTLRNRSTEALGPEPVADEAKKMLASAVPATPATPGASTATPSVNSSGGSAHSNSRDLNFGYRGGGAIDPLSAACCIAGLASVVVIRAKRRHV